jgi:outer membrane lipoprotein-sorting protein
MMAHHGLMLRRWAVAAVLIAALAALPYVASQLPAGGSPIAAPTLLTQLQGSESISYSGYAESTGSLALPVTTGQFSTIANLFGSSTQLRVWWRGDQDWRVDEITPAGEDDLHAQGASVWSWDYESNTAQLQQNAVAVAARLPRADDLVPANLARRLLSQATGAEVTRIASKRVAGHTAAGLRYTPAAAQSTIARIDVWALPGTGLPVAIAVYGKGNPTAIVSSTMLDLSTATPSKSTTAFVPPAGAKTSTEQASDLLALASRIQDVPVPGELAGLARDSVSPTSSAVTVYGTGVTVLVAIPVFGRTGRQIRDELTKAVGSSKTAAGIATSIGAANLLLTNPVLNGEFSGRNFTASVPVSWLLVGTVTAPTLEQAGHDLTPAGR